MPDCTKCQHRADLHPEYSGLAFSATPCATCPDDDPAPLGGIPYEDSVRAIFDDPTRKDRFRDFTRRFCTLPARQRAICWYIHDNPGLSLRDYCVGLKLHRTALHKSLRAIRRTVPEFACHLPKPPQHGAGMSPMIGVS